MCNRLLEIAISVQDREMIIDMLACAAHLYLLLGKYQLSYDIMKKMQTLEIENHHTHYIVVGNFSVVELLLGFKFESLQHAYDSLALAWQTQDQGYIACAYGNIGLAFENMGMYDEAIEPYKNCLQIGEEAKDYRVINNGLCNLGRAYQGLGEVEKAKEYFKKAIETPRPPKAYWCDTEDFRFSGDYLLAKLFLEEKNLDEARKQFMEVIKRCEMLRKKIQDSPTKITFNDTQRKPFQCLQHALLEEGKKLEALVVAEKGRGRDFFDKIEGEFCTQLDSEEVLLDMINSRRIAVLFISTLEEVGKLCLWFISSEGKLLKQWSIPYTKCDDIFTKLCVALYNTQGRHEIEFRGTTEEECSLINKALELIKQDEPGNSDANSSLLDTTGTSFSTRISRAQASECTQEQLSSEENYTLSDLIDTLSELILSPFREELEQLVSKRTTNCTPRLLIIPQGKTFNIPFAALKLNNNPLCNHATIIEAFSFNSFAYSTTESEKRATTGNYENALIVGNPTHPDDLPRAEEEARSVAEFLGVTPLVKDQATKEAVMKKLPSAPLIHVACHGETGGKGLALACDIHTR
jgi:tetratricopeptide (TPR) repeat protein